MSVSVSWYCENRIFRSGEFNRALRALADRLGVDAAAVRFDVMRELPDGSSEHRSDLSLPELPLICDLVAEKVSITCRFGTGPEGVYFTLGDRGGAIRVYVSTSDAETLATARLAVGEELALSETEDPAAGALQKSNERLTQIDERLDSSVAEFDSLPEQLSESVTLASRIEAIERTLEQVQERITQRSERLQCFLSYRFTPDIELYALRVQRFLSLLGVDVITGNSYEPRGISEKVVSRLSQHVDFVVLIVTRLGESAWTRDEISFASGRGASVVPLVEEGAEFSPGMFGDLEFVKFAPGHIGDSFVHLLEAVNYFRSERAML